MKRKVWFLLIAIMWSGLILSCDNGFTSVETIDNEDSRSQVSKNVQKTDYVTYRDYIGDDSTIFDEIYDGYYKYNYSDSDGYSGTLASYDFDVIKAPYIEGSYRVFELRVYYSGTVYKQIPPQTKEVEAIDYVTYRDYIGDDSTIFYEIYDGYYKYNYSDSDGYSGTLASYDFDVIKAPYIEGSYRVFELKVYYSGTVYTE
ncbi:hypothetical protein [Spirochaeta cellobiosiphila]|uniref:hypothetical protein n=1 Tax=Spirochaeta cellobiosiphila TaxID=504483 RepID=UPI0003F99C13|nr:hypothetical protein [Spirochaeta cellobiosiphila]